MNTFRTALLVPIVLVAIVVTPVRADEITDWNQTLFRAALVAGTPPLAITRVAAIVQAAVFDAVNGIGHRYSPIHVTSSGPAEASRDATAVGAVYTTLVALYPTQKGMFDARLAVSLAKIGTHENSGAISSGFLWGRVVAARRSICSRAGRRGSGSSNRARAGTTSAKKTAVRHGRPTRYWLRARASDGRSSSRAPIR